MSTIRTGTVSASAICAARYRRAPATISKPFSVRGRTSNGERTPWVRILSQSSLRAASSKIRRGLVFDSLSSDRDTLRYSVALITVVSMIRGSFRARLSVEGHRAARSDCPFQGSGLAENALVRKGGEIALRSEVDIPRSRKMLMLLM